MRKMAKERALDQKIEDELKNNFFCFVDTEKYVEYKMDDSSCSYCFSYIQSDLSFDDQNRNEEDNHIVFSDTDSISVNAAAAGNNEQSNSARQPTAISKSRFSFGGATIFNKIGNMFNFGR